MFSYPQNILKSPRQDEERRRTEDFSTRFRKLSGYAESLGTVFDSGTASFSTLADVVKSAADITFVEFQNLLFDNKQKRMEEMRKYLRQIYDRTTENTPNSNNQFPSTSSSPSNKLDSSSSPDRVSVSRSSDETPCVRRNISSNAGTCTSLHNGSSTDRSLDNTNNEDHIVLMPRASFSQLIPKPERTDTKKDIGGKANLTKRKTWINSNIIREEGRNPSSFKERDIQQSLPNNVQANTSTMSIQSLSQSSEHQSDIHLAALYLSSSRKLVIIMDKAKLFNTPTAQKNVTQYIKISFKMGDRVKSKKTKPVTSVGENAYFGQVLHFREVSPNDSDAISLKFSMYRRTRRFPTERYKCVGEASADLDMLKITRTLHMTLPLEKL